MQHILFLCTGNSARSIMAEAYMNHAGAGDWRAWSAGSTPTGRVNPFALKTLAANNVPAAAGNGDPSSQSWDDFAAPEAPPMDLIVTVCDNAAGETCPVWPAGDNGAPRTLHWSFPDPAAATGSDDEIAAAFETVFSDIKQTIDAFLNDQK